MRVVLLGLLSGVCRVNINWSPCKVCGRVMVPPTEEGGTGTCAAHGTDDQLYVWLGDLAGFQVEAAPNGLLMLVHRCGWGELIPESDSYLANVVVRVIRERARHRCG